MALTDLTNRPELTQATARELDGLVTRLRQLTNGVWDSTAPDDGRYTTGTAGSSWVVPTNSSFVTMMRMNQTMWLDFHIYPSSITGTPGELRILLPKSTTAVSTKYGTFAYLDNGTAGTGVMRCIAGNNYLSLFKSLAVPNWATATSTTGVFGQLALEVKP